MQIFLVPFLVHTLNIFNFPFLFITSRPDDDPFKCLPAFTTLLQTFCPLFCQITDRAWTEWILRAQQQFHKTRPLSVKSCKTWPIFSVLSLPPSVGRNGPRTDSGHSGHYGHSGFSLSRHYGPTALALFCTVALWRLLLFSMGCSTLNLLMIRVGF